ncbi:MAG: hypothetical protein Q8P02_03940 [Candidatus Micrarchaeota archaeon]|nr:hypothetical protein [Candidatus Micrarchaeota archaeon]
MTETVRPAKPARRVEPAAPPAGTHNQFSDPRRQQSREEHQAIADANRSSTIRPAFVAALIQALKDMRHEQPAERNGQPELPPSPRGRERAIEPEQQLVEAAIRAYQKKQNARNAQPREND